MFKVMIVDNETAIRKGLVYCIRWDAIGCSIAAQAVDGVDALEQFPVVQPDIVISDIRMPGMDGLELARHIRQEHPQTKVIIMTGFPDFEYAQRAIEYCVVDFVLKPTSVDSLVKAIEKAKALIAKEQSSQELARKLASESQQNLLLERGMLLHDLIHRVDLSYLYVLNRMAQLDMDLASYHVLRMDIVPVDQSNSQGNDCLPYLRQSQEVLRDCLTECEVYFAPRGDQMCYVVVCASDAASLMTRCLEATDIIGSMSRFFLFVGISQHWDNPLRMADAADQADQAAQFARYTMEQPVVRFDQIPGIPPQAIQRVIHDIDRLKDKVERRSRADSHEILKELFGFIRQNRLPIEHVKNICLYIYQLCFSLPLASDAGELMTMSGLKQLISYDSVQQAEDGMQMLLDQVLQQSDGASADSANVIRLVKAYIAEHYAEDISLKTLAGLVYLSPVYLSRLFSRETGETISAYVQNVRIERAKSLLRTTNLKIYEVAEPVGFTDPVYFSRIFKKATGIKPKDFRK